MYLVTGGAGFIGSHIVERLVGMGEKVRVLDNFTSGGLDNLCGFMDKTELVLGDLLDKAVVQTAMEGVEVVFHEAALRSVPFSVENPALVNRVNVEGTVNVLVAARNAGVRRVVYASSSSVYGNTKDLPKREHLAPSPVSPYAVSKLTGEYYLKVFTELYGLERSVFVISMSLDQDRTLPPSMRASYLASSVGLIEESHLKFMGTACSPGTSPTSTTSSAQTFKRLTAGTVSGAYLM